MSSRLALIREALRILDGHAPDELVVEGDGWSLIDPESVRQGGQLEVTTVVDVPLPPSQPPVLSLIDAMHDALDAAMSEGWELSSPPRVHDELDGIDEGWALAAESIIAAVPETTLAPEPAESPEDAQERAFFAAGEALASAAPAEGEYQEQDPHFWRRFWAKSA